MVQDWNEILKALDNLSPYKQNATIKINKPGITSSVPNYKTEKLIGNISKTGKAIGKGSSILGSVVPFYKDLAFPVAYDLYQGFIMGNPDKSNVLNAALNLAGIDRYGNKIVSHNTAKDTNGNTGVPSKSLQEGLEDVDPSKMGYDMSDIPLPKTNGVVAGQQDTLNVQQQQPLEGNVTLDGGEEIESIIRMAKDRNAPYIKALEQYLANYPKLLEQSARNNLYFYGANLAKGLNPKAGEKFDQVKNYGDMVALIKEIQNAKNADTDYNNELIGNMEVARNLDGLSPLAAFANKNLLTAYSMRERDAVKQAIANAQIKAKIYGIDERTALMRELQNMKGTTAENVARIYMGLTDGIPAVGLTPAGQAQSTSVAPVQYPQRTTNPLGDRFKQSVGH